MLLRGLPRAASHLETDVLVPQKAQAAFSRCIGYQSRRGLRNLPRCTNGSEDRRSSIPRRYGNYTSQVLLNFVPRCNQWVLLLQVPSRNARLYTPEPISGHGVDDVSLVSPDRRALRASPA
jgi:hypothetical protein